MTQPLATLLVGILTAAVTVGGWIVLHFLTSRRETEARKEARRKDLEARIAADVRADRVKRLEILLKQSESQISEFYGPINALIFQIWATWEIKHKIKTGVDGETYARIDHHFGQSYFSELHAVIRKILREKMYLVEGGVIPDSFYQYTKHSLMENIQIELWDKKQISTANVLGYPWSEEFQKDIKAGFQMALDKRQSILLELQSSANLGVLPGVSV